MEISVLDTFDAPHRPSGGRVQPFRLNVYPTIT